MILKRLVCCYFLMGACISFVFADSPLTSTPFYQAYLDEEKVQEAQSLDHKLTESLMTYLNNEEIPLVKRLAAINALSWTIDTTHNFEAYLDFLVRSGESISSKNFTETCTAAQLICLAYLKALDNHFDVADALKLADLALKKDDKGFYSMHLIHGIIKAQHVMDKSWCKVYQATHQVRTNDALTMDMNETANQIIFDYMGLYKEDCNDKKNDK